MNSQIYEEASAWLVELRTDEADMGARQRFERWLSHSPEHVRAYLELTALWEDAGHMDARRALDVDAMIARARAESNVVALQPPAIATALPSLRAMPRKRWFVGIAAAALATVFVGAAAWWAFDRDSTYLTAVGEQRSIRLEDGSIVEMNAASSIRVRFSERERVVDLLGGQALFKVAQAPNRPFTVVSAQTRVRAVGTQFDVYRKQVGKRLGTIVTVLEGRVAIVSKEEGARANAVVSASIELVAGEQITLAADTPARPKQTDVAAATAWTQDKLVFESAPLAEVAGEFNRYNTQRLIVQTPELDDFHVSGTFVTGDPATLPRFLKFLREQPGILVESSGDRILVSKQK